MHNNIANETTQRATLAEMLAARAKDLAEMQRAQAERNQRARETERAEALASADEFLRRHIGPQLADTLRITPAVDENALQLDADEPDEYNPRPGYLMLDLSGAGVDDSSAKQEAAGDPGRADRPPEGWLLRNEYIRYRGWRWILRGPHGYEAAMPDLYSYDACIDAGLLDALAAYPAWLAGADERAEEQRRKAQEQQAEQERKRQSKQVRHYTSIEGYRLPDGGPTGVLWSGNHLLVLTRDPQTEDGMMERRGVLTQHSEQWLLLTLDGHTPGTLGAQRLIPIASIIEIQPLPDVEEAEQEQQEETAAAS